MLASRTGLLFKKIHTVSVVVEVEELIVPLGEDSDCVFEESHYYEKTTDCW